MGISEVCEEPTPPPSSPPKTTKKRQWVVVSDDDDEDKENLGVGGVGGEAWLNEAKMLKLKELQQ